MYYVDATVNMTIYFVSAIYILEHLRAQLKFTKKDMKKIGVDTTFEKCSCEVVIQGTIRKGRECVMSGLSGLTQSVMDHYSANSRNSVRLVDIFFYNLETNLA